MLISMAGLGAACATLSMDQIYSIARNAGFPSGTAVTMTAIAMRESSGCPTAHNPGNPPGAEDSYGLWQINVKGNPALIQAMGIQPTDLYDPTVNAAAAYRLWNGDDNNLNVAWYINRPGYQEAYEKWLPQAQLAAARVDGGAPILADSGADTSGGASTVASVLDGSVELAGVSVPVAGLFFGGLAALALVFGMRR